MADMSVDVRMGELPVRYCLSRNVAEEVPYERIDLSLPRRVILQVKCRGTVLLS